MAIIPVPRRGTVLLGQDVAGRALRVTPHPEHDRVVLSIWQGERCVATVRLTPEDVPELVRALSTALLPAEDDVSAGWAPTA